MKEEGEVEGVGKLFALCLCSNTGWRYWQSKSCCTGLLCLAAAGWARSQTETKAPDFLSSIFLPAKKEEPSAKLLGSSCLLLSDWIRPAIDICGLYSFLLWLRGRFHHHPSHLIFFCSKPHLILHLLLRLLPWRGAWLGTFHRTLLSVLVTKPWKSDLVLFVGQQRCWGTMPAASFRIFYCIYKYTIWCWTYNTGKNYLTSHVQLIQFCLEKTNNEKNHIHVD